MNITFSFLGIGIVAAIILIVATYINFKILKLITKIIVIVCAIGAIFFYLQSINFDLTKLFIM